MMWQVESMIRRYESFIPEDDFKKAKEVIKSTKLYLENLEKLEEANDEKSISTFQAMQGFIKYKEGQTVTLNPVINLNGYKDDIEFNINVTDDKNNILVEEISFTCKIDNNTNKIRRTCTNKLTFNASSLKGKNLIKLRLYDDDLLFPDYLKKEVHVHLMKVKDIKILNVKANIVKNIR